MCQRSFRWSRSIGTCYDEPVTVALAAKAANPSPYLFHHTFKLAFNQTPMQVLQECRLRAAWKLLAQTDQPVTTIALTIGFESQFVQLVVPQALRPLPAPVSCSSVRRADSQD